MKSFKQFSNSQISNNIDEWIKNAKHREIAKRRLIDGIGYEYIADEFDMSRTQIINILTKCEAILSEHL